MKYRLLSFLLLCLACLLGVTAAFAGSAWDTAFSGGRGRLEHLSLLPEDCSGFEANVAPGNGESAAPVRTDEYGTAFYALPEESVRELFFGEIGDGTWNYRDAVPVSVGPDGAVLWAGIWPASPGGSDEQVFLFVQRDHEIVILNVSDGIGSKDTAMELQIYLDRRYNPQNGSRSGAEWSGDGRYISVNNGLNGLPPFLLDTRTGEALALFASPWPEDFLQKNQMVSCRAEDAHFSKDGNNLYLSVIIFESSASAGDTTFIAASHGLARYDLTTGELKLICRLPGFLSGFSVIDENRLMTEGESPCIVTLNDAGEGDVTAWTGFSNLRAYGKMDGPAVVAAAERNGADPVAFTVLKEQPEEDPLWYLLPADADAGDPWQQMTGVELRALLDQPTPEDGSPRDIQRYRVFRHLIPIRDTPYLLAVLTESETIPSWPDRPYVLPGCRCLLLNTGTMECRELETDSVWTPRTQSKFMLKKSDPEIRGDVLLIGETVLRLNPDADPDSGAGSAADPEFLRLDSLILDDRKSSLVEGIAGEDFLVSESASDSLTCRRYRRFSVPGCDIEVRISAQPGQYQVKAAFSEIKAPKIPTAFDEERYRELKERMRKPDFHKFTACYNKYDSKKLDRSPDREQMLRDYPALENQTLYIIRPDLRRYKMEEIEQLLAAAGYTDEEYAADMQYAQTAEADAGGQLSGSIEYVLEADGASVTWRSGPVAGLLYLTDYLAGTIWTQYLCADPRPESAASLPIQGELTFEYIPYQVTLDSVDEGEENVTTMTFTVIPAGNRGWIQD